MYRTQRPTVDQVSWRELTTFGTQGMNVVDQMYAGYGEGAPAGKGPNQGLLQLRGNAYLKESYPKLI